MGSAGSPPQYPGLSPQEQDLLQKQGITLDQFNSILNNENINAQQNQDLLYQLSGLYNQEDVAAIPGEISYTSGPGNRYQFLQKYSDPGSTVPGLGGAGNPGGMTLEQISHLPAGGGDGSFRPVVEAAMDATNAGNGGMTLRDFTSKIGSDKQFALTNGFAVQGAGTPAGKKLTLNQTAVEDLRKRVAAGQATQQELTDLEQGNYKAGLEAFKSQLPQVTELNQLALDRQKRALEGTLPVSQGLLDRKAEDFKHLQEASARRGINITGDTPETATSQSSAGNELMGQFNRTYGLLADQERRGEISGGVPNQIMAPGPASSSSIPGQILGYATAPGSGGLLGAYGNLANAYGGATQPYSQASLASYQGLLNSYNQNAAQNASYYQLGGSLLGGLMGMYGGSSGAPTTGTAKAYPTGSGLKM